MYNNMNFKSNIKKDDKKEKSMVSKFLFSVLIKTLVVVAIFLGTLIYIKKDDKNKESIKKIVYQNSLSFAKIYNVYKKYLGDVIPFKNTFKEDVKKVSQDKITYEKIEKDGSGYILTVSQDYPVSSIKSGIIVELRKDDKYNNIIKIQDKNGLNITYGLLDEVDVKLYDYVEKGQLLGKCTNKLYLIFEKDSKYLSYEEYL